MPANAKRAASDRTEVPERAKVGPAGEHHCPEREDADVAAAREDTKGDSHTVDGPLMGVGRLPNGYPMGDLARVESALQGA
jgi:hypothetical protein